MFLANYLCARDRLTLLAAWHLSCEDITAALVMTLLRLGVIRGWDVILDSSYLDA